MVCLWGGGGGREISHYLLLGFQLLVESVLLAFSSLTQLSADAGHGWVLKGPDAEWTWLHWDEKCRW